MASDFTATFGLEKAPWKTLRFDVALNGVIDNLDDALKDFASGVAPGQMGNHSEVILTEGVRWRDTYNHESKVRGEAGWETLLSTIAVQVVNSNGSTDLSAWTELIGSADANDPKYAIPVVVGGITFYIPAFTAP